MKKFDTKVQYLKYMVLKEVARHAWEEDLWDYILDIPKTIVTGKTPTMRCCVHKERAILGERVKLATGGDKLNPNVIEVIDIACDDCPAGGYEITNACRGCLAHRCADACKFGAISFDNNQKAHIDKSKCVECGKCSELCPYSAIIHTRRPCENSCKVKAISMSENKGAKIDNEKCVACGACVYQCPFGAISDKSYILNVIDIIKKSNGNTKYKTYAVVAPSIASQFDAKLGQVVSGLKNLGFYSVVEVALGADMAAYEEAGYLAGYAAVKDGYTNLGFMGGMAVPAVQAFGYGYMQGAERAAIELGLEDDAISMKYHYTGDFAETPKNKTTAATMYTGGTEIIFACGGSVGKSVMSAAAEANKKVIGVDVDQKADSTTVVTSATKGLGVSVKMVLAAFFGDTWTTYGGKSTYLNATNQGIGLPNDFSRFETFNKTAYDAIYAKLVDGTYDPLRSVADTNEDGTVSNEEILAQIVLTKLNVSFVA